MLLPTKNPYVSAEISLFDTLVRTGEEKSLIALPFHLHIFLVGCLVEHLRDQNITHHTLALGLLQSTAKLGERGNVELKRTGDAALLLAGFFPERALRLHVGSKYFRFMGQVAYASLAARYEASRMPERGKLYEKVARHFQLLERVLNAIRMRPETEWMSFQRFLASIQ